MRHGPPGVRPFAARQLGRLLPPRLTGHAIRGVVGPWRLTVFAAMLRERHALPPGPVRNASAENLCGWIEDKLVGELTGSRAPLLVTLSDPVVTAPDGAGGAEDGAPDGWAAKDIATAAIPFEIFPRDSHEAEPEERPERRVVVSSAWATPADRGADVGADVGGDGDDRLRRLWVKRFSSEIVETTREPFTYRRWRSIAQVPLRDSVPLEPGRWTIRLRGRAVPRGEGEPGLEWVSEPALLVVPGAKPPGAGAGGNAD